MLKLWQYNRTCFSMHTVVVENMSRFQSAFYLMGTVSSLYLCVSLFSYSAADLSGGVRSSVKCGWDARGLRLCRSFLHVWLFRLVHALSGFFGLRLAGRQFLDAWRVFGVSGLIWVSCCIWALLAPTATASGFFPAFGAKSSAVMTHLIGPAGAWFVVSGFLFGLGIFVAGQDLKSVSGEWLNHLEDLWPRLKVRSSKWGYSVLDPCVPDMPV